MSSPPRVKPLHSRILRSIAPWRHTILFTSYEPKPVRQHQQLRNFFNDLLRWIWRHRYGAFSCDAELDNEIIRKTLSSPLFIEEREESANLRQTCHSSEESLLPTQSFFAHTRRERPENELRSCQEPNSIRELENERIRILLERQISKFSLTSESKKHEFQVDSDRSIQVFSEIVDS